MKSQRLAIRSPTLFAFFTLNCRKRTIISTVEPSIGG
jgi:hypothetical protein